jgi:hypothetical protein
MPVIHKAEMTQVKERDSPVYPEAMLAAVHEDAKKVT